MNCERYEINFNWDQVDLFNFILCSWFFQMFLSKSITKYIVINTINFIFSSYSLINLWSMYFHLFSLRLYNFIIKNSDIFVLKYKAITKTYQNYGQLSNSVKSYKKVELKLITIWNQILIKTKISLNCKD